MNLLDLDVNECLVKYNKLKEMQLKLKDMVTDYFSCLRHEYLNSKEYLRALSLGLCGEIELQPDEDLVALGMNKVRYYGEKLFDFDIYFDIEVFNVDYHKLYDYFDGFCKTHTFCGPYSSFMGYRFNTNGHVVSVCYENYVLLGMPAINLYNTKVNYQEEDTCIVLSDILYTKKPYMHNMFNHKKVSVILFEDMEYKNTIDLVYLANKANVLFVFHYDVHKNDIAKIVSFLAFLSLIAYKLTGCMYLKILYNTDLPGSCEDLVIKIDKLRRKNIFVKMEKV